MGLFNRFKAPKVEEKHLDDLEEQLPTKKKTSGFVPSVNLEKIKKLVSAIGFVSHQADNRNRFERPEYNLWEIKEAAEADSYIKISLSKYSYLIYKAGASLKGDDERVAYLEQRFRMMSFATQKPMDILFQEVADDLIKYSNAFLVKKRIDGIPGMNLRSVLADKIVGGYFRVDPASIKIKRDKNGNILKYEQGYGENKKEFFPRDIIHFYMDKDANNSFGTPRIIAALEDVKLLRKIEGNVSALIYRFSMPIYQWMVGLPQPGMQGTDPEIEKAKRNVENSTLDGILITNERTTIKAIGAEGSALNAQGYLKYFEERVFSALGVSSSQMGRGGAKQDADSMEAQTHDTVKYIQRIMSIFIREMILSELLLEKGYNPILNEEDVVNYEFEEISLETKVKKENHEMLKYQSNLTSIDEARRKMGMKDNPAHEDKLYKDYIETNARVKEIDRTAEHQKEIAKMNIDAQKETAKINAANKPKPASNGSGTSASKGPRSSKSSSPNKAATNNNRPQNQHGTSSAKIKESFDEKTNKKNYSTIYDWYDNAKKDIIEKEEDAIIITTLTSGAIKELMNRIINDNCQKATIDAVKEISEEGNKLVTLPNKKIDLSLFYEESAEGIDKLMKSIYKEIESKELDIETIFDKNEYRLKFLEDFLARKSYWYSYVKTGANVGVKKAYIKFNSDKDAEKHKDTINTESFSIEDIPAYHSFCNCEVSYAKAGDK